MHQARIERVDDFLEPPAGGKCHLRAACGRGLGGIRTRGSVEQRQPCDPLRRLAHDLEGDVTAHRKPTNAKRGGALARMPAAMPAMVSARV